MPRMLPALVLAVLATGGFAGCFAFIEEGPASSERRGANAKENSAADDAPQFHGFPTHPAADAVQNEMLVDDWRRHYRAVPPPVRGVCSLGRAAFEPSLGIQADGTLFVQATDTNPLQRFHEVAVFRSDDQCRSWQDVNLRLADERVPPGTSDPYLHVDPQTGRVFDLHLHGSGNCNLLSLSDDDGRTWTTQPLGCGAASAMQDHPVLWTSSPKTLPTIGYPRVVHYCVYTGQDNACSRSLDGGLTWSPLSRLVHPYPGSPGPIYPGLAGANIGSAAAAPDGTVYVSSAVAGRPTVARSLDDGTTWQSFTIDDELLTRQFTVDHVGPGIPVTPFQAREGAVAITVGDKGDLHAVWVAHLDKLPYWSVSDDQGETWSAPRRISAPGITPADLPTIVAGDQGRFAVAYLATTSMAPFEEFGEETAWNGYVTFGDSQGLLGATLRVNDADDPLARGRCFATEAKCSGIGDFLDIVLDSDGRPWAAFVDVCNFGCNNGALAANDNQGFLATFAAGPSLRGDKELPPLDLGRRPAPPIVPLKVWHNMTVAVRALGVGETRFDGQAFRYDGTGFDYIVGPNVVAVDVHLCWDRPTSHIHLIMKIDGETRALGDGPLLNSSSTCWTSSVTDSFFLQHGKFRVYLDGNLAASENVRVAIAQTLDRS